MVRKMLFETRIGEAILTWLERRAGLALVDADELGDTLSGAPDNGHAVRALFWLAPVLSTEQSATLGGWVRAALLEGVIYKEEITHCAAGVRWLTWLHGQAREARGDRPRPAWAGDAASHAAPELWFHALVRAHFRGALRPPFNEAARSAAGFTPAWYLPLAAAGKGAVAGGTAGGAAAQAAVEAPAV